MCGIFGIYQKKAIEIKFIDILIQHSRQRGVDASGFIIGNKKNYKITKANQDILKLKKKVDFDNINFLAGHSRLVTNGNDDNQPIIRENLIVIHNGIIVNSEEIWSRLDIKKTLKVDTEIINAIYLDSFKKHFSIEEATNRMFELCEGVISCCIMIPDKGKVILASNNGSLYFSENNDEFIFASEEYPIKKLVKNKIYQINNGKFKVFNIPKTVEKVGINELLNKKNNLIPVLKLNNPEEKLLIKNYKFKLKRCKRCILTETMPFISFDKSGICNYCKNYKLKNIPRPIDELKELISPYKKKKINDCVIPFSGGRDSTYALHIATKELGLNPITFTYDWGMITDLGRRNISRMCSKLNVENIIYAENISKKRNYIKKNLTAWLKSPHLGMVSILTAGDKYFFKYVDTVKTQTGIKLNLWGINPLETTHFKSGFLGIKPDHINDGVYINNFFKQMKYQALRFKQMVKNPGYLNSSILDNLIGEYYRSFKKKTDYFHIFDYFTWDENKIEDILDLYDWERAPDTNASWRIGDGTAAFYNYVYYINVGFTEHDTFRSNQIREGQISREKALKLVEEENLPRYPNIRWYLDTMNMDFKKVIQTVNKKAGY